MSAHETPRSSNGMQIMNSYNYRCLLNPNMSQGSEDEILSYDDRSMIKLPYTNCVNMNQNKISVSNTHYQNTVKNIYQTLIRKFCKSEGNTGK